MKKIKVNKFCSIIIVLLLLQKASAQEKSYHCGFDIPSVKKELLQKVSNFDSLILHHGCPVEGCMHRRCIGIGFLKGKVYAVRIEFPFDEKKQKFDHGQIKSKLIKDSPWEDSIKHINTRQLILLNNDSLNFSGQNCKVSDGGDIRMIFIQKDSIYIKTAFEPEIYQECANRKDRQTFIDTLHLLYKHYYYTRIEKRQRNLDN